MTDNIPNRRGMVLLHYRPSDRGGALFGRATVELPILLQPWFAEKFPEHRAYIEAKRNFDTGPSAA